MRESAGNAPLADIWSSSEAFGCADAAVRGSLSYQTESRDRGFSCVHLDVDTYSMCGDHNHGEIDRGSFLCPRPRGHLSSIYF